MRLAAVICAVLLALAALWVARSVMTPVVFALFIIALVWPLQRRLKRRLPQLVAILLTAAVALFAIGAGCWLIVWGFGRIAQWVIANSARLQGLYTHLADLLEQRGLYAAELIAEQFNMSWIVGVMRGIGGSLQGIVSFSLVTFIFVILGLLELEPLGRRLGRIGDGSFGTATTDVAAEIAGRLQTYMLVRFGMSVLTGLGFWAFTAIYGLDLSREWGVIAFVLNFIPFIGSFIATLLPTLICRRPIYIVFLGDLGLSRPECRPVHRRQLYRAARRRSGGLDLPLHGAVRGIFLGDAVGRRRRLYRRPDPDCAGEPVRQKSGNPRNSGRAVGRSRDGSPSTPVEMRSSDERRPSAAEDPGIGTWVRCLRKCRMLGLAALLFAGGCSLTAHMNEPLRSAAGNAEYRLLNVNRSGGAESDLVLVALSGGGKRSAAFGFGVLRGMRDIHLQIEEKNTTLLDEVDLLAGVSGGSFPAAYFGLYGEKSFTTFPDAFLYPDIEAYIWGTFLLPWNWDWLFNPLVGTNDRMTQIYDRLMFHGATFADLYRRGRPQISINATDISFGSPFGFLPQTFDVICSDLASLPIARAVAASNGFPVVFGPVTLRNYRGPDCPLPAPVAPEAWERAQDNLRTRALLENLYRYSDGKRTPWIHLMDGGISDNLALRVLLNDMLLLDPDSGAVRGRPSAGAAHHCD